jgi:hypothetical protein
MTKIDVHLALTDFMPSPGITVVSCLAAALREARKITGRNVNSGIPDSNQTCGYLGSWSGAMCYMTILDQVGKCYRPKSSSQLNGISSIQKALTYFTILTTIDINALYALRNAFFHDFSLYNRNAKDPTLQHNFQVENHPTNPVVRVPVSKWDGKMSSRTASNITYINLKAFGDLVEGVYSKLVLLNSSGDLSLELVGGGQELIDTYTFAVS